MTDWQSFRYVIKNTSREIDDDTGDHLYWSNDFGWVGLDEATRFGIEELDKVDLPLDGEWRLLR
jgi:hypothetical protein